MTEPIMTGKCTEEQFWAEVARIGWKDENPRRFYKTVERELLERWDDEFLRTFREHLDRFRGALVEKVERFEQVEEVSCGCSDDGFSDLTNHVVGLGKEEYEASMKDPMRVVERGREYRYEESFSYCIPHERRSTEKLTYEQALEKARTECAEEGVYGWHDDEEDTDEDDKEGYIEQTALELMMGERAKLDVRYYAAWARRDIGDLEALAASEYADKFPDLPYVLECVTKIRAGKIAEVVDEGHDFRVAVKRLREQREALKREKMRELRVLEPRGWSLDNLASDALVYIGGEEDPDE